jgi:hypothetical protein
MCRFGVFTRRLSRFEGHGGNSSRRKTCASSVTYSRMVGRLLERRGQVGYVDQPCGLPGRGRQQPGQQFERADTRQIADVPLDDGVHIAAVPRKTATGSRTGEGRRVSARGDALGHCRPIATFASSNCKLCDV